ncbi:DNA N-6-adenine-methyltransferase [Carpediemonas membranifera]|uniref:DNA N-6-adenine-methyltransferase n=1 Tax=Carpediemonas membranifera TaxID=201153 RepID=A0A8J6B5Q3_9EUKA|nr:DNA N-6-adenine-methyltransferase [Carpediemonas membranifera]|eukprot:KAG9394819.1 DNA N-6-adenine-methyltransferase [Carpediemonas membranifera]
MALATWHFPEDIKIILQDILRILEGATPISRPFSELISIWGFRKEIEVFTATDASDNAIGGTIRIDGAERSFQETITAQDFHSIMTKELFAIRVALLSVSDVTDREFTVFSDNAACVSWINKQGSARAPEQALRFLEDIQHWAQSHRNTVVARHAPGHLNSKPDRLSRFKRLEWGTPAPILEAMTDAWGPFEVDAFATEEKLLRIPGHWTREQDGLSKDWHQFRVFAAPPRALLSRLNAKLAPLWDRQRTSLSPHSWRQGCFVLIAQATMTMEVPVQEAPREWRALAGPKSRVTVRAYATKRPTEREHNDESGTYLWTQRWPCVVVLGEERTAQEETATVYAVNSGCSTWTRWVDVEGVREKALLDSGAGVNLMSEARVADLGLTIREPGEIQQVDGLGDQPVPVIGRVTATLGGKPEEWCVVEPDVLFVGYDTLVKRGIVLPDMADKLTATTVPGTREDKLQRLFAYGREGTAADLPMFELKLASDARPFRAWPKKMGIEDAAWVRQEVANILRKGVIRPSLSPYASRVVLADKKGGDKRLCVDYRQLNKLTADYEYPLPTISSLIEMLEGNVKFSTLDLKAAFNQVEIEEEAKRYTAFVTREGQFEYNRMPFGLKCAAAHMQMAMETVLGDLIGRACLVYIDDIVVYGASQAEHDANLDEVVDRLVEHKVGLGEAMCVFDREEIEYVGWIVGGGSKRIDPKRIEHIRAIPMPDSISAVRGFLGTVKFVHDCIPHLAWTERCLHRLEKKGAVFERDWTDECVAAVNSIKAAIEDAEALSIPGADEPLELYTDACEHGIGAVLMVRRGDKRLPIGYFSKAIQEDTSRARWNMTQKEAFAIKEGVKHFRQFLRGRKFTVMTDHRNLLWMDQSENAVVERWALELRQLYTFELRHVAGAANGAADWLSRHPAKQTTRGATEHVCAVNPSQGDVETPSRQSQTVPESQKAARFREVHGAGKGHHGVQQTLWKLEDRGLLWDGAETDVSRMVKQCPVCQKAGLGADPYQLAPREPLGPFDRVFVDTTVMHEADGEFRNILTAVEETSRWVTLIPLKTTSSRETIDALVRHYLTHFPVPAEWVADNGSQFASTEFHAWARETGARVNHTTPYYHEENGVVERWNKEVNRHLRCEMYERQTHRWASLLPAIQNIINSARSKATGSSAWRLVMADGTGAMDDKLKEQRMEEVEAARRMIQNEEHRRRNMEQTAKKKKQDSQKRAADIQRQHPESRVAAGLWVFADRDAEIRKKYDLKWRGPLMVVRKVPRKSNSYVVRDSETKKTYKKHVSHLKVAEGEWSEEKARIACALDRSQAYIKEIVDWRVRRDANRTPEVKCRWLGFEASEDTWRVATDEDMRSNFVLLKYMEDHSQLVKCMEDYSFRVGRSQERATGAEEEGYHGSVFQAVVIEFTVGKNTSPTMIQRKVSQYSDYDADVVVICLSPWGANLTTCAKGLTELAVELADVNETTLFSEKEALRVMSKALIAWTTRRLAEARRANHLYIRHNNPIYLAQPVAAGRGVG